MSDQEFLISYIDEKIPYIFCKIIVDVTIPIASRMTQAIRQLGDKTNTLRYLIDLRGVRNIAGAGENYHFTQTELKELKMVLNDIALLIDVDDHTHIFIETLARNAGHNVKAFHSKTLALSWLASTALCP